MQIIGLQKMTLLDYPGYVACTVFLQGCNFKCPFCYNSSLISKENDNFISLNDFFDFLDKRKKDGFNPSFFTQVKQKNTLIATNGSVIY